MYSRSRERRPGCRFGCLFQLVPWVMIVCLVVHDGLLSQVLGNKTVATFLSHTNSLVLAAQQSQPHAQQEASYSVIGTPSLSASFINQVLASAHSPASGTGQALYDLGVKYDIDPAYALAFFQHESSFGTTGIATATRSLGNIRCSTGYTCISGFRAYQTWQEGYEDWYHLIHTLYIAQRHLMTVAQIIPVYAPSSDHNDVPAYIGAVERAVDAWRRGEV